MTTQLSHSEVCDMLTHYASNAISSSDIAEEENKENDVEVANVLGQFQRKKEFDSILKAILESYFI